MNFFLILTIFFITFSLKAQTTSNAQTNMNTSASENSKINELSKELFIILQIESAVAQNSEDAEKLLVRARKQEKNEEINVLNKKALAVARQKFKLKKGSFLQKTNIKFSQEIMKRFSSAELKYLVELSKHSLFQKYKKFLQSDEYSQLVSQPIVEAYNLFDESKNALLAESKNTTKATSSQK
ncbi:MAG: hypothetical protein WA160_14040 [Pseudobdellovibrio sp.]